MTTLLIRIVLVIAISIIEYYGIFWLLNVYMKHYPTTKDAFKYATELLFKIIIPTTAIILCGFFGVAVLVQFKLP